MIRNGDTQLVIISHEAIRAVGEAMAKSIGSLAAQEAEREPTIAALNSYADQVPYAELFAEDDRLATALETIDNQAQEIDETLRTELERLDGLASTFATKMPKQLAAAKQLVEQKKAAAKQEAETGIAQVSGPRDELAAEYDELRETINSVVTAWPVEPYSEEVLEAVEQQRAEEQRLQEELESQPSILDQRVFRSQLAPEKKVLGPHAELAGKFPNLSERLLSPKSEHTHVHDEIETAREVFNRAQAKPQAERTEEEDFLWKSVYLLSSRFLRNPKNLRFLEIYEAKDIIDLTQRLRGFSRKNRPDFNDLEGQILDKASTYVPFRGKDVPDDIKGAVDRMNRDAPGRSGMTWASLSKHANRACDTMRARFFAGGHKNMHLKKYVIDVTDRSGTKPDISWLYQFVADNFAFDVLGRRRSEQQVSTRERFMKNCETIDEWLEESRELLDQLPKEFRLRRQTKQNNFRVRHRRAEYENVTARTSILNTIKDIGVRRDGTGDSTVPRHKPLDFDAIGALNHQLRLGHMVDALKEELSGYAAPTEGRTEEITPFE